MFEDDYFRFYRKYKEFLDTFFNIKKEKNKYVNIQVIQTNIVN